MSTTFPAEPTFTAEQTSIPDYTLYLRKIQFLIGDASGNGLDLSNFQLRFSVTSANSGTLRQMEVRIYNLSDTTAKQITSEFIQVSLSAGYQDGPFGEIFSGLVTAFRRGREDATTTFLDVLASDGDISYNFGIVNTTLAAGYTYSAALKVITDSLTLGQPGDVTAGNTPDLPPTVFPRGRAIYGSAKAQLRRIGQATQNQTHIRNGKLILLHVLELLDNSLVVLNAQSGLIGIPEQTVDGLSCRSLLNPTIVETSGIQVDGSTINQTNITRPFQISDIVPGISANNTYKVYWLHHFGDNRGNDFYTDIAAAALVPANGVGPFSEKYRGSLPAMVQQQ